MFKLAGSRQEYICVMCCISLEEFMHNRKQIITQQAFDDLTSIRRRGDGIGIVDEERVHWRIGFPGEDRPQAVHI